MEQEIIDRLKLVLIIIGITAGGLFLVNQFLDYYFKMDMITNACVICEGYGNKCEKKMPSILELNLSFENFTGSIAYYTVNNFS